MVVKLVEANPKLVTDCICNVTSEYAHEIAARYGHTSIVKYLVSKGADVWTNGMVAFKRADHYGYTDLIKYLTSIKCVVTYRCDNIITDASKLEYWGLVKYLADAGADASEAIVAACEVGNLEMVKYLVNIGVSTTAYDNMALRRACVGDNLEVVKYLISVGCRLSIGTKFKLLTENGSVHTMYEEKKCIALAKQYENTEIVNYLNKLMSDEICKHKLMLLLNRIIHKDLLAILVDKFIDHNRYCEIK